MSDTPVDRSVGAPPPRRTTGGGASTLIRANRTQAPTPPPAPSSERAESAPIPAFVEPDVQDTQISETPSLVKGPDVKERPDDIVKFTFDLRREDRDAFRAAFAAAKYFEGVESLRQHGMDLVRKETKRLEDTYNNGQRFEGGKKGLPRGDQSGLIRP